MLLRWLTALAILASAALHVVLYLEWAKNLTPLGPAFLAQAAVGVLLAVLLVTWRSPWPLLAAVLFGLGSLAAFFVPVISERFGVTPQLVGWQEYLTKGAEALAVVLALLALVGERRTARSARTDLPAR